MNIKYEYEYAISGKFESLLKDYYKDKNNIINHNRLYDYILFHNSYQAIPDNTTYTKYSKIKIKNYLLNYYQIYLNYDILSRLLYYNPEIIKCIKEDHKDYKQLKELYEFLTI